MSNFNRDLSSLKKSYNTWFNIPKIIQWLMVAVISPSLSYLFKVPTLCSPAESWAMSNAAMPHIILRNFMRIAFSKNI